MRAWVLRAALIFLAIATVTAARPAPPPSAEQVAGQSAIEELLARVGERVEEYFARAQSIVCQETVRIEMLDPNFAPSGAFGRRVVSELRVAWESAENGDTPEATVQRQILTVNGRPPRPNDEDACFDPKAVSPEPLAMFLMPHRADYLFTAAGTKKINGRASVALDYKPAGAPGTPQIVWKGQCVSVDLPGWSHGRVFLDATTGDVLRLDESITRRFEFPVPRAQQIPLGPLTMAIDRVDSSIRYKPVAFHDPDETVLLPESIDTLQAFRNRTRIVQTFSNYRRFITGARLVKEPPR